MLVLRVLIEYIASLRLEGITTLMSLDALAVACHVCRLMEAANIVRICYLGLKATIHHNAR